MPTAGLSCSRPPKASESRRGNAADLGFRPQRKRHSPEGMPRHPAGYHPPMPPYKGQGIVLRSVKLGEADKIVTILTQGSGKVRGVAKGIRKTTSRFGGRLEPFTHVNLMLYRGRGALDTITQADIIAPHRNIRDALALFAAG